MSNFLKHCFNNNDNNNNDNNIYLGIPCHQKSFQWDLALQSLLKELPPPQKKKSEKEIQTKRDTEGTRRYQMEQIKPTVYMPTSISSLTPVLSSMKSSRLSFLHADRVYFFHKPSNQMATDVYTMSKPQCMPNASIT